MFLLIDIMSPLAFVFWSMSFVHFIHIFLWAILTNRPYICEYIQFDFVILAIWFFILMLAFQISQIENVFGWVISLVIYFFTGFFCGSYLKTDILKH
jgi:hypothetical protein